MPLTKIRDYSILKNFLNGFKHAKDRTLRHCIVWHVYEMIGTNVGPNDIWCGPHLTQIQVQAVNVRFFVLTIVFMLLELCSNSRIKCVFG